MAKTKKKVRVKKAVKKKVVKKTAEKKVAPKTKKKVVAKKKVVKKTPKKKVAPKAKKKAVAKKKVVKKTAKKKVVPKTKKKAVAKKKVVKKAVVKKKALEKKKVAKKATKSLQKKTKKGEMALGSGKMKDVRNKVQESIENIYDKVNSLAEHFPVVDIHAAIKGLDFFASKTDECLEKNCDNLATTLGYCRYHYIKNWKAIKVKQEILEEGKLTVLIEELVSKFPFKYIETVLTDLQDDKSFYASLKELNIETEFDDLKDVDGEEDEFESSEIRNYKSEKPFENEEV